MKLRTLGLIAAVTVATPALATGSIDLGDVYVSGSTANGVWTGSDALAQSYTFSLTDATTSSHSLTFSLADNLALKGLVGTLYRVNSDSSLTSLGTVGTFKKGGQSGDLNLASLVSGLYQINVVSTGITNIGLPTPTGSYTITLKSDIAAPVPGPAAPIVAAVGVGVVAYRKRRARKAAEA